MLYDDKYHKCKVAHSLGHDFPLFFVNFQILNKFLLFFYSNSGLGSPFASKVIANLSLKRTSKLAIKTQNASVEL